MLALAVILLIAGVPCCVIGAIFLRVHFGEVRKAALVRRVPTSPASAVATMPLGRLVEVQGTLRCPRPLKSELAGQPCVYARTWVERMYQQQERDSDGTVRTVERTETLASSVRVAPCYVEDASGRVRVLPDGAEVDGLTAHDHFEERPAKGRMKLGRHTVDLNHGLDTLGYRFREEILPLDGPVYVLGVVTAAGEIAAPTPGTRDAAFIISRRSEAALSSANQGDRLVMWCGAGALAGGILLITIGLVAGLLWI
jgi:hypothetical protein